MQVDAAELSKLVTAVSGGAVDQVAKPVLVVLLGCWWSLFLGDFLQEVTWSD